MIVLKRFNCFFQKITLIVSWNNYRKKWCFFAHTDLILNFKQYLIRFSIFQKNILISIKIFLKFT